MTKFHFQPNDLKEHLVGDISQWVTRATGETTELNTLKRATVRDLTTLMLALQKQEPKELGR